MVVRNARLGAPAKAPPARSLASATGSGPALCARQWLLFAAVRRRGYVGKDAAGYSAAVGAIGGAEGFRMQATRLGSYLFYGRDRDFMAAGLPRCRSRPRPAPSPDADWQVDDAAGGAVHGHAARPRTRRSAWRRAACVLVDPGERRAPSPSSPLRAARCTRRSRPRRTGTAVHEPHAVGRGQGHHRRPHARDGLRVPRRQRALRQAVVTVRRAVRARRLPRPLGRQRLRRGARERASTATRRAATTRSAGRRSRTGRTTSR